MLLSPLAVSNYRQPTKSSSVLVQMEMDSGVKKLEISKGIIMRNTNRNMAIQGLKNKIWYYFSNLLELQLYSTLKASFIELFYCLQLQILIII